MRLVYAPGGLGVLIDRAAVEGSPSAILAASHIRANHVGVKLRILRTRHPVPVRRRHESASGLRAQSLPSPRVARLTLRLGALVPAPDPTRLSLQI